MEQLTDIQVLFLDTVLLVINKPSGMGTLPDGYDPSLPHIKSILEPQYGRLWIVHRLDKFTSGVLLLARTASAHRSLNAQFEKHSVIKQYRAVVINCPAWEKTTVDLPLRPNGDRQHRTVIDPEHGKPAVTHFTVLERLGRCCLIQAIPETGRTHQIRAHLSTLGLSILGDKLYGGRLPDGGSGLLGTLSTGQGVGIQWTEGIALHAWSLEISHPQSGERQVFRAAYPDYWVNMLAKLRLQASPG